MKNLFDSFDKFFKIGKYRKGITQLDYFTIITICLKNIGFSSAKTELNDTEIQYRISMLASILKNHLDTSDLEFLTDKLK